MSADTRAGRSARRLSLAASATTAAILLCAAAPPPARAASAPPNLSAKAAALVELSTGRQLYGLNARSPMPIASATKLMTALIALERAPLGATFAYPNYQLSSVDSQIGLTPGERMSVHDLLVAMLLPSADDAAEDLAYNIGGGSVSNFIAMMNARAKQLGLTETHYTTPIGLDTPGNYSSAQDLVKLAAFLLRTQPFFKSVVAQPSAILRTGAHVVEVENRNDLVGRFPWVDGVKTGHTLGAGYVLVGAATGNGMTLISAVLGTSSEAERDSSTLALLGYGFANFQLRTVIRAGAVLARPAVRGQGRMRAAAYAGSSLTQVLPRSAITQTRLRIPAQLTGPLRRNSIVGSAVVLAGGRAIGAVPLLVAHAVPAPSGSLIGVFFAVPFTLLVLVCLLTAAKVRTRSRRERMRGRGAARSA